MTNVLKLNQVDSYYDNLQVLRSISLEIQEGKVVALLGGNGAGKTTVMRTISGVLPPRKGDILFFDTSIAKLRPDEIVKKGISQVPQGRELFSDMTVLENLEMGAVVRNDKTGIKQDIEMIHSFFPVLKARSNQKATTLSGGEQQMLAIARSLMSRPKLLLMDEPTAGLAPLLVKEISEIIIRLKNEGKNIFLVEQNVPMAMEISDFIYFIKNGEIVYSVAKNEVGDLQEIAKQFLE
jgi:branched-chain amino acid transport system ATP-binding protein